MDTIHVRLEDTTFRGVDSILATRHLKRKTGRGVANARPDSTFLRPPLEVPLDIVSKSQQRWDSAVDRSLLFKIDTPEIGTQTHFYRGGRDFQIISYEEIAATKDPGSGYLSVNRGSTVGSIVGATREYERETAANVEEQWLQQTILAKDRNEQNSSSLQKLVQAGPGGLLDAAPSFSRGIRFLQGTSNATAASKAGATAFSAPEIIQGDLTVSSDFRLPQQDTSSGSFSLEGSNEEEVPKTEVTDIGKIPQQFNDGIDELLPVEFPSLQPRHSFVATETKPPGKEWAHMVDLSAESSNLRNLIPSEMAQEWPFELDAFQKEAIYHLECGDSVFVAAHTSAGKTVVAEYAIALAQKHQTKAIYTSPIKALSNQKFRDFKNAFDDVGILTGDVQINQEAKCLIMTTEILRSKLYSQSDLLREVEFVIFDEVHYVSDADRGVVWEEVIIMLPEQVSMILLSATVPNTYEFASWVGRTKKRDVYVISTPKRPVPLEHYLWSGKTTQKIVSAGRKWLETGYREAKTLASGETQKKPDAGSTGNRATDRVGSGRGMLVRAGNQQRDGNQRGRGGTGGRGARGGPPRAAHNPGHMGRAGRASGMASLAQEKTLWSDVVRYLRKASLLPACIFVFSRVRCEEFAMSLNNLDFCDSGEKTRIHSVYSKSVSRLSKEDQDLPQIIRLRDLATRGIAVHHGGLLPIVKEIVELLFAQSLVKVLFATETFAVGLNLPTRTVVFSDHRKFDGTRRRVLSPGEYTQMAGRAGRRGLDTVGTAIIVPTSENHDVPPAETLKSLILGQPSRLTSQFRLTYNMILSLHRVETLKVEDMMKRSFSEHTTQRKRPENERQVQKLESELAVLVHNREPCEVCNKEMASCLLQAEMHRQDTSQMYQRLAKQHGGSSFFCRGRIIVFINEHGLRTVGVIDEDLPKTSTADSSAPTLRVVEIQTSRSAPEASDKLPFVPALYRFMPPPLSQDQNKSGVGETSVPISNIELLVDHIVSMGQPMQDTHTDLNSAVESLGPLWNAAAWQEVNLDKVRDVDIVWYVDDRQAKSASIFNSPALACPEFLKHYFMRHEEWAIQDKLAEMRRSMDDSHLALLPEYENRIAVLKHLGFVNSSSVVMLKGRVACEIRTADELVLTEAILNNLLAAYEPAEIAVLLSIFVYQGKDDTDIDTAPFISNNITRGLTEIYRIWKDVIRTQEQFHVISAGAESGLTSKLHFGLVEVVYEWASGSPFKTIAGMTAEQEGTIVRTITRLEETCREVRNIGRIIGDTALETKMNGVREAIMRNITTVPSLYL